MKKSDLANLMANCRAQAKVDPQAALLAMSKLNVALDFALQRITKSERDILLADNDRAMVRIDSQTAAFARGELIL